MNKVFYYFGLLCLDLEAMIIDNNSVGGHDVDITRKNMAIIGRIEFPA